MRLVAHEERDLTNTKAAIRNQRVNNGDADHCLSCPNTYKPQFENTNNSRETNTYKRRIRELLEIESLDKLNVDFKNYSDRLHLE